MDKQILFCVEANSRASTDYIYIKETLDFYYEYDNHKVSIKPICMGTKTKYNSKKVQRIIAKKKKDFSGRTIVIYCIDTDNIDKKYQDKLLLDDIYNYCKDHDCELIWFCVDIENVYWKETVSDKQKVKKAAKFRNKNEIRNMSTKYLTRKDCKNGYSNFLLIMDKYLKRKI